MNKDFQFYEPYKDMYNNYKIITLVNRYYRLYFDKKNKIFVIINIAKNNQICYKFKSFSTNIIKYLQYSKIERSEKIFKYIDNFNENLKLNNIKNIKLKTYDSLQNLTQYSKRVSSISQSDINKVLEGNYA